MYKPRVPLKNILQGHSNLIVNLANSYCVHNDSKVIKFGKCLVVSKLSRYEFERNRHRKLNDRDFENMITNRGTNLDKLLHHHHLHKAFEFSVTNVLQEMGMQVQVVNRINYKETHVQWADVIFPTGGDGTFLLAASKVRDINKPVIGLNSDPRRSEGHLSLPKKYSKNIKEAFDQLKMGNFQWLFRNRIRTTLFSQNGNYTAKHLHGYDDQELQKSIAEAHSNMHGKVLPLLALNEVFIGENQSSRVSHLEMNLDGLEITTNLKCSGLCVSTGTGSTSWHLSINQLPTQTVAELIKILQTRLKIDILDGIVPLAKEMSSLYNKNLMFKADDTRMGYTIRDLISLGVWPDPKGIQPRGFAKKINVKSCCYDAGLVIDGGVLFSFNDGTVAVLEISPEDCLRTVQFNN